MHVDQDALCHQVSINNINLHTIDRIQVNISLARHRRKQLKCEYSQNSRLNILRCNLHINNLTGTMQQIMILTKYDSDECYLNRNEKVWGG